MIPQEVPSYTDGTNSYPVIVIINDINGMAVGQVTINGKNQYVIRWNGDDDADIGFPQSQGKPVWMIIADGIKLSVQL